MLTTLKSYPNLRLVEASVEDIQLSEATADGSVCVEGVLTKEGELLEANRVVITTGTFLRGQ